VIPDELDDLENYLDATRAELLFARGAIFVEGDAEEALMPIFAASLGHSLDELGITVCNVAGTNFRPYVKLAEALALPYCVITDWDPLDGSKPPLGKKRTFDLWQDMLALRGKPPLTAADLARWEASDHAAFSVDAAKSGIFLNEQTFEVSVANTPALLGPLLDILSEQDFGSVRTKRIAAWRAGTPVDAEQLLAMVASVGKGRLGGRLAKKATGINPPSYIESAIHNVVSLVAHAQRSSTHSGVGRAQVQSGAGRRRRGKRSLRRACRPGKREDQDADDRHGTRPDPGRARSSRRCLHHL
jgi:putative ATP-dependent endonuclease of OLD family